MGNIFFPLLFEDEMKREKSGDDRGYDTCSPTLFLPHPLFVPFFVLYFYRYITLISATG